MVTVPEGFVSFGMPGVWFLSRCPPAVMGSCLAVRGDSAPETGGSESVKSLVIPSGGENICFTHSISPSSHLSVLIF